MVLQEEELTFGCGEGGTLIGCTFCFNAAHSSCCGLGDQRKNAPRGDWACPACIDHAREQLRELRDDSDNREEDSDGGGGGDGDGDSGGDGAGDSVEDKPIEWIENTKTTVRMLRVELKRLGLQLCGRKSELVQRYVENSCHPNLI